MESSDPAPLPINPYESPGIYLSEVAGVQYESILPGGAWRDELLLVIPARGPCAFPDTCIKTGKPLARPFYTTQTVTSLPLNHPLTEEKWPVSREWEEDIPLSQLLGLIVTVVGFFLLLLSLVGTAYHLWSFAVVPVMTMALFSIFAGLMMLAFSHRVFLTAVHIQPSYVWLEGAHPDFLKELPPWTAAADSQAA